jgi:biotin synthase-like enzyme
MIGIGPYIAHAATPLGSGALRPAIAHPSSVPSSEEMVYKMIALARIVCPDANIPSTTALATINKVDGRKRGLMAGANVVMPNLTPVNTAASTRFIPRRPVLRRALRLQSVPARTDSLAGPFCGRRARAEEEASKLPCGIVPDPDSQLVQLQA